MLLVKILYFQNGDKCFRSRSKQHPSLTWQTKSVFLCFILLPLFIPSVSLVLSFFFSFLLFLIYFILSSLSFFNWSESMKIPQSVLFTTINVWLDTQVHLMIFVVDLNIWITAQFYQAQGQVPNESGGLSKKHPGFQTTNCKALLWQSYIWLIFSLPEDSTLI